MTVSRERQRRPDAVLAEDRSRAVDGRVGQRARCRFVEEAVEEKPKRPRRCEALERAMSASSEGTVGVPEWTTSESTAAWVRGLRQERDGRDAPSAAGTP